MNNDSLPVKEETNVSYSGTITFEDYPASVSIDSELFYNDLDDLDFTPHYEEDDNDIEDIYGFND